MARVPSRTQKEKYDRLHTLIENEKRPKYIRRYHKQLIALGFEGLPFSERYPDWKSSLSLLLSGTAILITLARLLLQSG